MLTKVVIIGPESTGKTELAQKLALHYKALWIPEYAREYISQLDRKYTYEDVEHIARRQIQLEEEYSGRAGDILFFDTDLIISKVWFDVVYKRCPAFIPSFLQKAVYHVYLLCKPDIPWVYDPVRENPHLRWFLFEAYRTEILRYHFRYEVIEGFGDDRFNHALQAVSNIFPAKGL